jgi:hypothetical protein
MLFFVLLALPILTCGLHHFSARQIISAGGLMGSAAHLIGSFAGCIEILILTHGVMYGVYMLILTQGVLYSMYIII